VDVWQDLGKWTADSIREGQRLFIVGTLNKESYSTRGGREHMTIVKAKYIRKLDGNLLDGRMDLEVLKEDNWPAEFLHEAVEILSGALSEESVV
jgi:single-stranded DNA-binding protein